MEKIAYILYLVVIAAGPVLFGAVHTWSFTLLALMVLVATLLLLGQDLLRKEDGRRAFRFPKTGMLPLFLGFVVLLILQMTPLPGALLFWLSPEAKVVGSYGMPASGPTDTASVQGLWHTLAPYVFPVRQSLVRWIVYGLLFFGLVRTLNTRRRIETLVLLILCLGAAEALYGIMQTYSGSERMLWARKPYGVGDVSGTYDSRNHFAGLMEMGIVLAAAYAGAFTVHHRSGRSVRSRRGGWKERILTFFSAEGFFTRRFLIIFTGVIMGVGLALSKSRGGIIAMAVALFVLGLGYVLRRDYRRKGSIILALFLLMSAYALVAGIDKTVERFKKTDLAHQERVLIGEGAVEIFAEYPLTGVGVGNFRYAYPKFQDPKFKRLSMVYAHNDWKQLLSEAGLAGLILLVGGMGFFLFLLIRQWLSRTNAFSVCLGAVPFGALTAMAVHAWSDFNLRIPANFMMLAAMLAIGFCALYLEEGRRLDRVAPRFFTIDLPRGAAAMAVVLAGVLWAGVWSVRHLAAESHCPSTSNPTLRLNFQPALADIRRAVLWDDANAAYAYKEGMLLIREMDEENRRWIDVPGDPREKAQARDPLQRRIVAALEAAVRRNPLNAEYHVRLGWEYTHLWYRPDYAKKWLAASDTSMERAAHVGGGWAENPHLHLELGNYWIMRSRSLPPGDLRTEAAWTRAWWHYRQSLALDSGKASRQEIAGFVNSFYPGQTGELDRILKEVTP